MKKIPHTILYL